MRTSNEFGQYCPLSMASQLLGTKWTMLVIREILKGYSSFNDIARGVPLMSRTLLSTRLKQIEQAGLISRKTTANRGRDLYIPTAACEALSPVLENVAKWGQEWIATEPSLEDIDTDFLMWDMRANVKAGDNFPPRLVVQFHFPDGAEGKKFHWLIFESGDVDVCYIDPGYEVDVHIEAMTRDMVGIWMGWLDLDQARHEGTIKIEGPSKFIKDVKSWLKLSIISAIPKRPSEDQIFRSPISN